MKPWTDPFTSVRFDPEHPGQITPNTDETRLTTPLVEATENAAQATPMLYFNPINFSVQQLFEHSGVMRNLAYKGTIGSVSLQWQVQVLPYGTVARGRFAKPGQPVDKPYFYPDSDHTYWSDAQPPEWSWMSHLQTVNLSFSWDSCNKSEPKYGTLYACDPSIRASGLNRVFRWDETRKYDRFSEFWP